MRASLLVGLMAHCVFMLRMAVLPPQGDHERMPGLVTRSKLPLYGPLREIEWVTLFPGSWLKLKTLSHVPVTPLGIWAKPFMSVSRIENLFICCQHRFHIKFKNDNVLKRLSNEREYLLEAIIEFHINSELAVLAMVDSLGARAGLNLVLREGSLKDGASGIDLNVGRAFGAAGAEEADAMDLDLTGCLASAGLKDGGSSGSKADKASNSGEDLHFDNKREE